MASEELEPLYKKFHDRFHVDGKLWYKIFQVGRTFLLVCALNIFDCYSSLKDTFSVFASLLTVNNWHILMLTVSLTQRTGQIRPRIAAKPYPIRFITWYGLFLIILLAGAYGVGYDASQFIYNQF